jgi:hypothetical protein
MRNDVTARGFTDWEHHEHHKEVYDDSKNYDPSGAV